MLDWVIRRLEGDADAIETPIGNLPAEGSMNLDGLGLTDEQTAELFAVEPKTWIDEAELTEQYYSKFGDRVPAKLQGELSALRERLEAAQQN